MFDIYIRFAFSHFTLIQTKKQIQVRDYELNDTRITVGLKVKVRWVAYMFTLTTSAPIQTV